MVYCLFKKKKSVYLGVAILCVFVFHITFFGSCMAVFGYLEDNGRNSLLCYKTGKLIFLTIIQARPLFYITFSIESNNHHDQNAKDKSTKEIGNFDNFFMIFFRDKFSVALQKKKYRFFIIALYIVYLLVTAYGLSGIVEGLERQRLTRYDSYASQYFQWEDRYFRDYPYRISVSNLTLVNKNRLCSIK